MAATAFNAPLAQGQLPAARAALYTVPAARRATVTLVTLVNTDTVARTLNLYVNTGSVVRRLTPKNLSLDIGFLAVYDDEFVLDAGWSLDGDASAATVIDFTVSGIEQ